MDYLDALDIDAEIADDNGTIWKQFKMMFEGEDMKMLQTLIHNGTITPGEPEDALACARHHCDH